MRPTLDELKKRADGSLHPRLTPDAPVGIHMLRAELADRRADLRRAELRVLDLETEQQQIRARIRELCAELGEEDTDS